jgi:hypothetical protein
MPIWQIGFPIAGSIFTEEKTSTHPETPINSCLVTCIDTEECRKDLRQSIGFQVLDLHRLNLAGLICEQMKQLANQAFQD